MKDKISLSFYVPFVLKGEKLDYWIWFSTLKISSYKKFKLLEILKIPEKIYKLSEKDLNEIKNIDSEIYNEIIKNKDTLLNTRMIEYMAKNAIKYITIYDDIYPDKLKNIYDPPVVLFYKGNINMINNKNIAIVGARKASQYGIKTAYNISKELSDKYTITSGLALGIDSASHKGSVNSINSTIAVIGSGLDYMYPKENIVLYNQILKKGLILSEYPVGVRPLPTNFPARNRIISGLSDGVIVVEASQKSGSLITVDFALEQGKNVYAVPGNIDSLLSYGTNELIKNGAIPYTCIEDIIQ
jgi:DNA processing protein